MKNESTCDWFFDVVGGKIGAKVHMLYCSAIHHHINFHGPPENKNKTSISKGKHFFFWLNRFLFEEEILPVHHFLRLWYTRPLSKPRLQKTPTKTPSCYCFDRQKSVFTIICAQTNKIGTGTRNPTFMDHYKNNGLYNKKTIYTKKIIPIILAILYSWQTFHVLNKYFALWETKLIELLWKNILLTSGILILQNMQ